MSDFVSIIIPVYNSELFVEDTIKSVINQSYSKLEIIIVDDGSTDNSGEICDYWASIDKRIKVFHIENSGVSAARNYAIEKSTGEYIFPVDSDDVIDSTFVEKAVDVIKREDNIGIVCSKGKFFGNINEEFDLSPCSIANMLLDNCICATALFRKTDWHLTGGYSNEMVYGWEDYDFWLSILETGRRAYRIPEVLFYYRIHGKSRTDSLMSNPLYYKAMNDMRYTRHKKLFFENYIVFDPEQRIILYGAGHAGRTYYDFLKHNGIHNIVCWVDKNYKNIEKEETDDICISTPDAIQYTEYDGIVIAIHDPKVMREVRSWLVTKYNCPNKIFWYLRGN